MKKIMFNDKYGLTEAVLTGRKTMTRRMVNTPRDMTYDFWNPIMGIDDKGKLYFTVDYCDGSRRDIYPQYQIGEDLAVAQSYKTIYDKIEEKSGNSKANEWWCELYDSFAMSPVGTPGYNNKMFVIANAMPHSIRITNIKVERLQDISEEDAMKEGVEKWMGGYIVTGIMESHGQNNAWFRNPRDAFFRLFTKLCGYKAWKRNPWVFAYTFELVR